MFGEARVHGRDERHHLLDPVVRQRVVEARFLAEEDSGDLLRIRRSLQLQRDRRELRLVRRLELHRQMFGEARVHGRDEDHHLLDLGVRQRASDARLLAVKDAGALLRIPRSPHFLRDRRELRVVRRLELRPQILGEVRVRELHVGHRRVQALLREEVTIEVPRAQQEGAGRRRVRSAHQLLRQAPAVLLVRHVVSGPRVTTPRHATPSLIAGGAAGLGWGCRGLGEERGENGCRRPDSQQSRHAANDILSARVEVVLGQLLENLEVDALELPRPAYSAFPRHGDPSCLELSYDPLVSVRVVPVRHALLPLPQCHKCLAVFVPPAVRLNPHLRVLFVLILLFRLLA